MVLKDGSACVIPTSYVMFVVLSFELEHPANIQEKHATSNMATLPKGVIGAIWNVVCVCMCLTRYTKSVQCFLTCPIQSKN